MLGKGCPWKSRCSLSRDAFHEKHYCNETSSWERCPERPCNYGDKNIERNYNYHKGSEESAKIGQIIIFIMIIVGVIGWFFK